MNRQDDNMKQIASQLLAAMLSNPHIYSQMSDEGGDGNMEQKLMIASVEMAGNLIDYIDNDHRQKEIAIMSKK